MKQEIIDKILTTISDTGVDYNFEDSKDGLCINIKIFKEKHDDEFYRHYFGL